MSCWHGVFHSFSHAKSKLTKKSQNRRSSAVTRGAPGLHKQSDTCAYVRPPLTPASSKQVLPLNTVKPNWTPKLIPFCLQESETEKRRESGAPTQQLCAGVHVTDDVRFGVFDLVVKRVGVDAEGLVHYALRGAETHTLDSIRRQPYMGKSKEAKLRLAEKVARKATLRSRYASSIKQLRHINQTHAREVLN